MLDDKEWERLSTLYNSWIDDVADILEGLSEAAEDAYRSVEGTPLARGVLTDLWRRIDHSIGDIADRTNTLTVAMATFLG